MAPSRAARWCRRAERPSRATRRSRSRRGAARRHPLRNLLDPFLEEAFRTDYYRVDIAFNDDDSWSYVTRTDLAVRGKTPAFDHRDTNTLRRVAPAAPNPLVGLLKEGKAG